MDNYQKIVKRQASILLVLVILSLTAVMTDAHLTTIQTSPAVTPATMADNETELLINITGQGRYITAAIYNNGTAAANDIFMKMIVTGGILKGVNKTAVNAVLTIPVNGTYGYRVKGFFGLGIITIDIVVRAVNAPVATATATGILIGRRVYIVQ